MSAEQHLKDGDIAAAISELKQQIRADASNPKFRIFLFQLLAVTGDWQKALDQLNLVGDLNASTLPMVQTYRETIACEGLRKEVFAGRRTPLILGEPDHWIALLIQSLGVAAAGKGAEADGLRDEAFEQAPTTSGTIDGQPFEWIADADRRLGPVLEAIMNGRYYWVPFHRIQRIELEAPCDLRDAVWLPVNFTWAGGGETVGFIPTRYQGSEMHAEDAVKLARKTEWEPQSANLDVGRGQRMLATDGGDFALMDIRQLVFDVVPPASNGESETLSGAN
jgi:type VI secretion system protein ImpE